MELSFYIILLNLKIKEKKYFFVNGFILNKSISDAFLKFCCFKRNIEWILGGHDNDAIVKCAFFEKGSMSSLRTMQADVCALF